MTNERQQHEGTGRQLRVDDMSGAPEGMVIPPAPRTTRARVAAENPGTHVPMSPERYKASYEAARQGAVAAQRAIEEATDQIPPEPEPTLSEVSTVITHPQPKLQADLRQLAFTGRVEEEVIVGGYAFIMRTLTSKENNEAAGVLGLGGNEVQRMGELRHAILARAIQAVNGMPLEGLYQGADAEKLSILRKRELVIGNWQQTMVTELMLKYNELLERSQKSFSSATEEDLKN